MAKYSGILQGKVRGKIGGIVFTEVSGVGTVGREYVAKPSNPKSYAQQVRRVKLANLVNAYKASAGWMKAAFESKKAEQSDYNRFVSLNLNRSNIALTKEQAANGACVITSYDVSEGTLPSIALTLLSERTWATNISLGELEITSATTVGEFSSAVIANNAHILEGMQLTFVSYMQTIDEVTGYPRVICTPYEVTFDSSSVELLDNYLPIRFAAASHGTSAKVLGTGPTLADGAFCYILSQRISGKIKVSSQRLQLVRNDIWQQYVSAAQLQIAIQSYGATPDALLAPGSLTTEATPIVQGIAGVEGMIIGSDSTKKASIFSNNSMTINTLSPVQSVTSVKFGVSTGTEFTAEDIELDGNTSIIATFGSISSTAWVTSVTIVADGVAYSCQFQTPTSSGGGDDDEGGLEG